MAKRIVGLDIETYDPLLKISGWSWKHNQGYILNTALYYEADDKVVVIAGINNENCPYSKSERLEQNKVIENLLRDSNVCVIGANLQYDIGWLLHEYNTTTYDVKCSFVDVLQAESILDEFSMHSLDTLSWKYLKYGKTKDRIEDWVKENVSAKGDFRKYLKDAPYDLLCEYVIGDAKNPVKIWRKQLTLLKEQELCTRCKMEFDCILPTLQMSMNGMPFDNEGRKKNCAELIAIRDELKEHFEKTYNFKNFNVNSSQHIAKLCDMLNIPYKCKITLKGYNGAKFADYKEIDSAYAKAKKIVASFQYVKSIPVAYVPSNMADRTVELLQEEGFMLNCSPNVDKKFFASQRDNFEVIANIADWKQANGIISKILGDEYERFICTDDKIRQQFKITDTTSFRYSCVMPNLQQIPSKNSVKVNGKEFSFPEKVRGLFTADKDCVFGKIDYGQIEYRLICNIACGEAGEEVRRQYAKNPHLDFHQYVVDLTGLSRKYAKNMSFGCFDKGSYFLTNKGYVKADCLFQWAKPLSLQGKKQSAEVSYFKNNGLRFTLSNGVQFCVTENHLFMDCETTEQDKYKEAKDMRIGDRLPQFNNVENGNYHNVVVCGYLFNKQMAYLAGLYLGDGSINSCVQLIAHKENIEKVKQYLNENSITFSYREESKVVRVCVHKGAKEFFSSFGTGTHNKRIPDFVYSASESVRLSFIAGMLDSDGSVAKDSIRLMGTNEKLLRDFALLCSMLNFDSGFNVCHRHNKPTEYTLLIYNTNNKTIPSIFRKTDKVKMSVRDTKGWKLSREELEEYRTTDLYKTNVKLYDFLRGHGSKFIHNDISLDLWQKKYIPVEIVNIEKVDEVEFVYLHTETEHYVANAIATHNCSFGMGLKSMADTFGWSMEKAEEISTKYHEHMPFVQPTLALVGDVAKKRGYVKTVCGSHARLPNLNKSYTMLNRYTQGSGAECLKASIIQAYKEGVWERLKVANTVHDELNMPYLKPTEESMKDLYRMAEIMRSSVKGLRVPLEASPELGDNWASTKEVSEWIELKNKNDSEYLNASKELKEAVCICEKLLNNKEVNV